MDGGAPRCPRIHISYRIVEIPVELHRNTPLPHCRLQSALSSSNAAGEALASSATHFSATQFLEKRINNWNWNSTGVTHATASSEPQCTLPRSIGIGRHGRSRRRLLVNRSDIVGFCCGQGRLCRWHGYS